jgi:small membrane protein
MAIILVIFPNLTLLLAGIFGVGRGADLLLYLCFVIGLLLYLSISVKLRKIQLTQTELIRYISLNKK